CLFLVPGAGFFEATLPESAALSLVRSRWDRWLKLFARSPARSNLEAQARRKEKPACVQANEESACNGCWCASARFRFQLSTTSQSICLSAINFVTRKDFRHPSLYSPVCD